MNIAGGAVEKGRIFFAFKGMEIGGALLHLAEPPRVALKWSRRPLKRKQEYADAAASIFTRISTSCLIPSEMVSDGCCARIGWRNWYGYPQPLGLWHGIGFHSPVHPFANCCIAVIRGTELLSSEGSK